MRVLLGLLAAGAVLGLTVEAQAQPGWYAGAQVGANIVPDYDTTDAFNTFRFSTSPGYAIVGQVGYGFGPIRLEAEIGWRENDMDKLSIGSRSAEMRGFIDAADAMANIYYDIPIGPRFTPYVGAGVGGAWVMANDMKSKTTGVTILDNTQTALAYQAIGGVSYAVDNRLGVKAEYRYFATERLGISEPASLPFASTAHFIYRAHSLFLGFTYAIGPAPQRRW